MKAVVPALLLASLAFAQYRGEPLTNGRVEAMLRTGVPVESIIRTIRTAPDVEFLISSYEFTELTSAGASNTAADQILEAMHQRNVKGPLRQDAPPRAAAPMLPAAAVASPARVQPAAPEPRPVAVQPQRLGASPVDEVGVYFRSRQDEWIQMLPEVVNWKTGGVLKSIGTAGVVRGDINGHLTGGNSHTKLNSPVELLIYCPEGTEITEYQLIRLHQHPNDREFRTMTGGVFHVSGGAERDTLEFTPQHIAQRTWVISIGVLTRGEYGVLPPGLSQSRSASAQLGKMYTFSSVE